MISFFLLHDLKLTFNKHLSTSFPPYPPPKIVLCCLKWDPDGEEMPLGRLERRCSVKDASFARVFLKICVLGGFLYV